MKFVEVTENFETFIPGKGTSIVGVKGHINLDNIELIRFVDNDNGLLVFLVGRDKALKITDKDSIDKLVKECKIDRQPINE